MISFAIELSIGQQQADARLLGSGLHYGGQRAVVLRAVSPRFRWLFLFFLEGIDIQSAIFPLF
jgi:hypothetical protein